MSFGMFVTWVLVGALVGVLAGLVMKDRGYGLRRTSRSRSSAASACAGSFAPSACFPTPGWSRWRSWRRSVRPA